MRIQEEKIELLKKVHRRICVRDITFLAACHLMSFFLSTSSLSSTLILLRKKNLLQKIVGESLAPPGSCQWDFVHDLGY